MDENKVVKKKMTAKRIIFGIMAALFVVIVCLCFIGEKPERFTEEEHIARITRKLNRKIKKKFSNEKFTFEYDSFEVYPLYNQDDILECFLVEFEPSSFIFIHLFNNHKYIYTLFGGSIYEYCKWPNLEWSPYTFEFDSIANSYIMDEFIWKTDENGEKIVYNKSPYAVAGVEDEKKYLFYCNGAYILAVKRDDTFLNLVSMTEVLYDENGKITYKQPYISANLYAGTTNFL